MNENGADSSGLWWWKKNFYDVEIAQHDLYLILSNVMCTLPESDIQKLF